MNILHCALTEKKAKTMEAENRVPKHHLATKWHSRDVGFCFLLLTFYCFQIKVLVEAFPVSV